MSARERALANLLLRRGLLTPGALARVQASRGSGSLVEALVAQQLSTHEALRTLGHELSAGAWACPPCQRRYGWDDLARMELLACPACGQALQRQDMAGSASQADSAPTARGRSSNQGPVREFSGQSIGPYELVRELGRGSNGVVYLGRRAGIERFLAVKILRDADQADEETVARFQLEAAVASKLQHPGIAAVHDVGRDGGHLYYAMDYVKGPTLKERLRSGAMDEREAAVLIGRLAKALAHAHDAGVIHRDIKPANIILEEDSGKPRIMDFGLARDRSLLRSMTQSGDVIGTPFYMSPEQFRGQKNIDHRVDIYALGAIFYEALAGQRPYTATTALELAEKVIRGDPPPPSAANPQVSPALERICLKAMAVNLDDRYPTASALRDDLERALRKQQRAEEQPAVSSGRSSQRPVAALIALGVLVLGVGGAFALVWSAGPAATPDGDPPTAASAERGQELLTQAHERLRQQVLVEQAAAPYPQVRALLERAVRLLEGQPMHAEGLVALAEYTLHRGEAERALALLERVGPESPQAARCAYLRGRLHEETGGLLAAREAWAEAQRLDPTGPWGAAGGLALARDAGKTKAARAALGELEDGPDVASNPAVLLERAQLLLADSEGQVEAELLLERLVQLSPDDPAVRLAQADLRLRQAKLELARSSLEWAVKLTTPFPHLPALRLGARLHLAQGEHRRVVNDCDQALSIAAGDVWALTLRGLARLQSEDPEGARADLERAGLADVARQKRLLRLVDPELDRKARALFDDSPAPRPSPSPSPKPSPTSGGNPFGGGDPFTGGNPFGGMNQEQAMELLKTMLGGLGGDAGPPWGELTKPLEQALGERVVGVEPAPAREALQKGLTAAARGAGWAEAREPIWLALRLAPDSQAAHLEALWACLGRHQLADADDLLQLADRRGWETPWLDLARADLAWRRLEIGPAAEGFRKLARETGEVGVCARALLALLEGDVQALKQLEDVAETASRRCPPAKVALALGACLADEDHCEQTYSEVGLLDLRLLVGHIYAYTMLKPMQAAGMVLGLIQRGDVMELADEHPYYTLFLTDVRAMVPPEKSEALIKRFKQENPMMAMGVEQMSGAAALDAQLRALPDSSYKHLVMARHSSFERRADACLAAWRTVLGAVPAFGVPAADRTRLERRFPDDARFAKLGKEE